MIVLIINENDSHIIRKLYEKYSKFMFKIALDILKDNYSAEDAVQQSLIRIIENIDKIDESNEKRTRNFIGIIVRNISINIYNKNKSNNENINDDIEIESKLDIPAIIISKESIKNIEKCISNLSDTYKLPIMMMASGYDYKSISKILGISEATARKRIERGRTKLKNILSKEDL